MANFDLIEILSESILRGTGTPHGVSSYKERCPRKARLKREARAARTAAIEAGDMDPGTADGSHASRVGTAFHKLEELHMKGELLNIALPIDDQADCDEDPIQEALRVFHVYRRLFPANEFKTIAIEKYFPNNDQEKSLIEVAVGVSPFTLQIDRAVTVDSKQAQEARDRRGLDLVPGGFYLYDTKTHDKKPSDAVLKYELEIQFPSYMMAWNAVNPDMPVLGLIVNDVVRNQKLELRESDGMLKCFRSYLVDYPSGHQQKVVRQYLQRKKAYLATDEVNLDACTDWGICGFYKNGLCDRL